MIGWVERLVYCNTPKRARVALRCEQELPTVMIKRRRKTLDTLFPWFINNIK